MRKVATASRIAVGLSAAMLALTLVTGNKTHAIQDEGPPRALVLSDIGNPDAVVASMTTLGWDVTTADMLETELMVLDDTLQGYDVVWVPAETNQRKVQILVRDGNALEAYARKGGKLVVWGLRPDDDVWIDIAPGGTDITAVPDGSGAVTLSNASDPLFSGGAALQTVEDLDPTATGGGGCMCNLPERCVSVVVAENGGGPVLLRYRYRLGHVVLGALVDETSACRENVLRGFVSIER